MTKDKKKFDLYFPIFSVIAYEPIYEGEFYGLDHETAKQQYEQMKKDGFYD